jgi:SAM-dependent methyltransferase
MPQRFDDAIRDQQQKEVGSGPKLTRHIELLRKTLSQLRCSEARLLDAGCGQGDYLWLYSEMGLRAVGADISPVVLKEARDLNPSAALELVRLESEYGLPHRDSSFDVIFCGEVMPQIRDVHLVLSEFNRVLRDGGLLILTAPYHGWAKNVLIACCAFGHHYYPHNYRLRFFTPSSLMKALQRAGFAPEPWRAGDGYWPLWKTMYITSRKFGPPGPSPNPFDPNG